jgi:hypothetical protein
MISKIHSLLLIFTLLTLSACENSTFSSFLDDKAAGDSPTATCAISSASPTLAAVKIAAIGGTTTFNVGVTNSTCKAVWQLNGITVPNTDFSQVLTSSQIASGAANVLTVTVSNAGGSESRTWNITKNTPPSCASRTPSSDPAPFSSGTPLGLSAAATDADGDALSGFVWKLNDITNASFTTTVRTGNTSSSTFTATALQAGIQKASLTFTDGYDVAECSWNLNVTGGCSITSVSPTASTNKMSNVGASQNFIANASNSSCSPSWTLNGAPLAGVLNVQTITSTQLTSGIPNILTVSFSDGTSVATRTWTINKNTPPTCALKAPASNPAAFSYNASQSFSGAASDSDGDALSGFTWKFNDSPAYSSLFSATTSSIIGSSTTFSPTASQIGAAQKVSLAFTDGYDAAECEWTMPITDVCTILSNSPSATSFRIAANGGSQDFTIGSNSASCIPTWSFNGAPLTGSTNTKTITSTQLNAGSINTLTVTITNGTSITSRSWSITKNNPPVCNSRLPALDPAPYAYGASQALSATGSDADGDTLSGFTWKFNGAAAAPLFNSVTSITGGSSANFVSTASQIGAAQKVSLTFTDGYDVAECAWTMNISNQCSLTSSLPVGSTFKMAQSAGTTGNFTVVPNDSSCAVTWALDGVSLGTTGSFQTLTSSQLHNGAGNILTATLSNGTSSTTRSWNVARNQLPSCASKSPATDPAAFVYTNHTKTFTATGTDPDGDTLTSFNWKFNDSSNPSAIFTSVTGAANSSTMTFWPTVSQVGVGQKLSATFSDGYDTAECYWNFDVANSCSITSSSPSTATYKVANAGTSAQNYVVIPSDASCVASWTLNGSPIAGSNTIQNILSSSLTNGSGNTLSVQVSNGVSSANRSWAITRNQVPTCASKSPSANPTPFPYTVNTVAFTGNASDADGDTLTGYTWKFNDSANPSAIYHNLSNSASSSSMTFFPTGTQVGTSQKVSLAFTDGYDAGECTWNFQVSDPNTIQLVSCNPVTNPLVIETIGANSTKNLAINALNASTYSWTRGGAAVAGASSSILTVDTTSGAAGNYTYVASAADSIGSAPVTCAFNVKINGKPVITATTPTNAQSWRVNWGDSLNFSVSATDPNSDTLFYTWKLDNTVQTTYLNSNTNTATFNPSFAGSMVSANNPHTISVEVYDGSEITSYSWTVEVNKISVACNALLNGNVATAGGKICTFAGVSGIGSGINPSTDQTLARIRPVKTVDDGSGNWYILDGLNNVVLFYNRSVVPMTVFGKTAAAGTMISIIGNGSAGVTADNNFNGSVKINAGLYYGGLAYDSSGPFLYVADWGNSRVLRVDGRVGVNAGKVTTVIGAIPSGTAPANNTAGNTDGNPGTTHVCTNPADVLISPPGGPRYLYVTCYSTHTVKRMVADISLGSYGNTSTVIGRLTAGASSAGPESGTFGATGDSRTVYPWALANDSSGNIYFSEGTQYNAGGGARIRMINFSGSTVNFWGGTTSPTQAFTLTTQDLSGTPLTSVTKNIQSVKLTAAAANTATLSTIPNTVAGTCSELHLLTTNASTPSLPVNGTTFTIGGLAGNAAANDVFTDVNCTTPLAGTWPNRTATVNSTAYDNILYYKRVGAGATTLTLSSSLATNTGVVATSVAAPGAQSQLGLIGPTYPDDTACQKYIVQVQTSGGAIATNSLGTTRYIRLSHNATGTFYSDASCLTPSYTVAIANGATDGVFYFKAKVEIPAGQMASISGNGANIAAFPSTTYTVAPTIANGGLTYWGQTNYNQPRGIAIQESSGVVTGLFVSSYNYHRVIYTNNNVFTPVRIGWSNIANTVPANQSSVVAGTGTGQYNGDGDGMGTRLYNPIGLSMTNDGKGLIIADQYNFRVRVLDLSNTGVNAYQLTSMIGAGRQRLGNLGDSAIESYKMYFNYPGGIAIDSATRTMYVTDSSSGRVRRMNLLTGEVDTIIGNGVGAGANEGLDPTTVSMQSPRGLTLVSHNSTKFLVYSDQASNTAINNNCQLRAMNMTSSNGGAGSSYFYTNSTIPIGPSKVNTVVGDYALGCMTQAGTGVSTPLNTKLYNPEGIASDSNGNIYSAIYNDNCVIKIAPDGTVTVVAGVNGVCTNVGGTIGDGSDTTNAVLSLPTAVAVDPRYSAYGNLFIADALTSNPSRIRYVNYSPTTVQVGSISVPGATAPNGVVMTIWTISPSSNSAGYVYGLASTKTADNKTHLCYAAGLVDNGTAGAHNVQCYDLDSTLGSPDMRAGPDHTPSSSVRAGTTVDSSQEGVAAGSALLYAPYGLAFDADGNLYISERSAHQIRMVRRWW